MPLQHLGLVLQLVERSKPVRQVGVTGHQPEGPPFATSADQDPGAAWLDRTGTVQRSLDPVVTTYKARAYLGEHEPANAQRLVEPVHALAYRREVEAVPDVLGLVP